MRIISQNLMDFPYEQIVVSVDNNKVFCKPVNKMDGRYYLLGEYENNERAVQVFNEINKAYYNVPLMDGDGVLYNQSTFYMPEA